MLRWISAGTMSSAAFIHAWPAVTGVDDLGVTGPLIHIPCSHLSPYLRTPYVSWRPLRTPSSGPWTRSSPRSSSSSWPRRQRRWASWSNWSLRCDKGREGADQSQCPSLQSGDWKSLVSNAWKDTHNMPCTSLCRFTALSSSGLWGGAGLGMSSSMRAGSTVSPFLSTSDPTAFESKGSLAGEVAVDEAELLGEIEVRALVLRDWMAWGGGRRGAHWHGFILSGLASCA